MIFVKILKYPEGKIMLTVFKNGFVYNTGKRIFEKKDLYVRDGLICEKGDADCSIDCTGRYIIPGLVDVHTHGRSGYDFNTADEQGVRRMREEYAKIGTTTVMATLASATMESFEESIAAINKNRTAENGCANIAGIHLEGRYLNPKKRGAHAENLLAPLDADEAGELIKKMMPLPVHVSAALEEDGAEDFTKTLIGMGATVALAHSDATYDEAMKAVEWGATAFTHTFNAMRAMHHREPGCAVASMLADGAYTELICDGEHVNPAMIKLCDRAKADGKTVLITDSMEATGCPDGEYSIAGMPVFVKNGKAVTSDGALAGSTLDLWTGLMNFMAFTGKTLEDALPCATINPANEVGIGGICGSIEIGKRADFIILNEKNDPEIESVYVNGEKI